MASPTEPRLAHQLRHLALAVAALAALVTPLELVFAEHYKDAVQLIPFAMILLTLLATAFVYRAPGAKMVRLFRWLMLALFVTSLVGVFFHLRGNLEVVREIHPEAAGWSLVWGALTGAAPALAPGLLAQVGLLGLIYTYNHPALAVERKGRTNKTAQLKDFSRQNKRQP